MQNATSTKTIISQLSVRYSYSPRAPKNEQESLQVNIGFFNRNLQEEQPCFHYATHITGLYTKHRDLLRSEIVN